jgi:acyl-coenzyme A thioesterase PaaI-like protein
VVRTNASAYERLAAAEAIERVTAALSESLRDTMPWPPPDAMRRGARPHSPVIGRANPFAPPMDVRPLPDGGVEGSVTMQPIHEGPPGVVHGGLVAALLDQLLGHANAAAGVGGMTAELTVRYHRPTPYSVPLVVRARHDGVDGRRIHASGEIVADGVVTARAHGLFLQPSSMRMREVEAEVADDGAA